MADRTEQQASRRRRPDVTTKPNPRATADEIEEVDGEEEESGSRAVVRGRNATATTQAEEAPRGNILTRTGRGLAEYFEGVRSELRKVAWPSREDARRLTVIVLVALVISSIILGGISLLFTELFRIGLSNPLILIVFMVIAVGGGLIFNRINKRSSSPY